MGGLETQERKTGEVSILLLKLTGAMGAPVFESESQAGTENHGQSRDINRGVLRPERVSRQPGHRGT